MADEPTYFRVCSTCRKPIEFEQRYYQCSVSTCNRGKTALYFCSVDCWSAHVPILRHRDAWAEEEHAPERKEYLRSVAEQEAADHAHDAREPSARTAPQPQAPSPQAPLPKDVLVVVSKLKAYVRARSGFNTSDGAIEDLSDHLRALCDQAIRVAARENRKTVMGRDFREVLRARGLPGS